MSIEFENDSEDDIELDVAVTGARVGDVIIGQQKCTMKAMLRVYTSPIFPMKKYLDELRDDDEKWERFLAKLSSLSFFANMTRDEREEWMDENETTVEFIGDDREGGEKSGKRKETHIEILDVGTSTLTSQVESEDLEVLMEGKEEGFYSVEEIESRFPRKPGSNARKHTLFFMKQFWVVVTDYKIVTSFDGVVFDIENGEIKSNCETEDGKELIVIDGITKQYTFGKKDEWVKKSEQKLAFLVSKERFDLSKIDEIVKETYKELSDVDGDMNDTIRKIRTDLREYTAGSFKSLMQKIIRFGPDKVSLLDGEIVDGGIVILVVVAMLAQNPGSFVPDIQRYVTGLESVAKRLGIICGFEDSYTPPERVNELVSLFSGALLAQRVRSWKPNRQTLKLWMTTAYKSLNERRAIDYEKESSNLSITDWWTLCHKKGLDMKPYAISEKLSPIKTCSAILDTLRSFEGDIGMARHIASVYPKCELIECDRTHEVVMPLCHGTDQHWAAGFIYFFTPKTILQNKGESSPFDKIFTRVFQEVTGFNPRRDEIGEDFEDDEFVKETRRSQMLYLVAKQNKQTKRKILKREHYKSSYQLNDSWLAGMVSAIEIPGSPATIVTLRPENIYQLIAIRKPSRNMAENITPEREEYSKKTAKEMLKNGIKLKGTHPPSEFFKGASVKLVDDEYIIISADGISMTWEDARDIDISLPYHNAVDKNIENSISQWGEGIEINAFEKLDKLIAKTNTKVMYRVLSYIANYKKEFEMNRVSRDGNGTYQSVSLNDVRAYQFILTLSQLFPAALRPVEKSPQKFLVPVGPLLWNIVTKIKGFLCKPEDDDGWDEVEIKDSLERVEWTHQKETTEEMIRNFKSGTKGNFLWLRVGLGKCLHPDTKVLLWDGSMKRAEDVQVGDRLIGDDNTYRNVLTTCTGEEEMFEISQIKGDSYKVNRSHILSLKFSGHKGYYWSESYHRYSVTWLDKEEVKRKTKIFTVSQVYKTKEIAYDTMMQFRSTIPDDDIIDISVNDYLSLPQNFKNELKGFKVGVDFPSQIVFMDPYLLGVWLGDGYSNGSGFTNIDEDCINSFVKEIESMGCHIYRKKSKGEDTISYAVRGIYENKKRKRNHFLDIIRYYGMYKNKHIPKDFLINDREIRLQVLAGLIDTDGYYNDGCYEIIQKRKELSDNILYLVRSLGFNATQKEVQKTCTNSIHGRITGTYHRCIFSGEGIDLIPCKIERKRAPERMQVKDALSTGVTVKSIGNGKYCGFTIDGNSRFLLGDFTVTHNTLIVMNFLSWLKSMKKLSKYILYTLPPSAIESVVHEIQAFGLEINYIIPLKSIKGKKIPKGVTVTQECVLVPYAVNIIAHDHLRRCSDELLSYASECTFLVDEVHKGLNETKRTSTLLDIARLSRIFVAFTGTPVIDNKIYKLIWWLEQIVEFEVNLGNFWVSANSMVARKISTGVRVIRKEVVAKFKDDELSEYKKLVPVAMGGENKYASNTDFNDAYKLCCNVTASRRMIEETMAALGEDKGVMLVAQNRSHQDRLKDMLVDEGVKEKDIFILTGNNSIFLTDEAVKKKIIHDYKVVIVPMNKPEGYTLTRLTVMVTCVYPSNEATREQIEGRINRISQAAEEIEIIVVHCGILTYILKNHNQAKSLSIALSDMAKKLEGVKIA
ncbi:MAG: Hint domain-containing homing endonuclease [Candidatus Colwellbacteria bacterium]|nr:Hint domain-containing homing endonuclease [Candidatus Colwellbacteria bacterium]